MTLDTQRKGIEVALRARTTELRRSNSHDEVVPALAQRHGRQRGVRIYIPEAVLKDAFSRKDRGGKTYEVPERIFYVVKSWTKKTALIRFGAEGEL